MSVIYYYFYFFYKKIRKDDDPHMLTVMALSASEAFVSAVTVEIFLAKNYCYLMDTWAMFSFIPIYLLLNYLFFIRGAKHLRIVQDEPKFFNSSKLSAFITLLFFLFTDSFIFWGPFVIKNILEDCK